MARIVDVSYSELDAYRQCPLKWQLAYQQLWSAPSVEGTPLNRGSAWHAILQTHYTTIKEFKTKPDGRWTERLSKARTQELLERCATFVFRQHLVDPHTGEVTEQQDLLAWMYQGYLEMYGIDESWQILGVEQAGRVPLLTERGHASRFRLRYKVDLAILDLQTRQLKVLDHKSAQNFSRPAEVDIDDQFGLYTWAWWREHGRRPISIIRSDARTQRNKGPMLLTDRFQRVQTFRSDRELDNIALDAYRTAKMAYGRDALVHSSPAPDRCVWRCQFLEAHLAMRKGLASADKIMVDFGFSRREAKHPEYNDDEIKE